MHTYYGPDNHGSLMDKNIVWGLDSLNSFLE